MLFPIWYIHAILYISVFLRNKINIITSTKKKYYTVVLSEIFLAV